MTKSSEDGNNSYGSGFNIEMYNSSANLNLLDFDSTKIEINKLYYFTYNVTPSDIKDGFEFVLSYTNLKGSDFPRFVYMDVGQSGGGQEKVNVIENVDFIKTNATGSGYIKTTDTGFKLSNVTFEIFYTPEKNTADTFIFYFKRNTDDSIGVLFYVNRDDQSSMPGYITKKGSGNYGYATSSDCSFKNY